MHDVDDKLRAYQVKSEKFVVDKRYELIDMIGAGAYGVVVAAKDLEDLDADDQPKLVAIKKMVKVFDHRIYALRTLREMKI